MRGLATAVTCEVSGHVDAPNLAALPTSTVLHMLQTGLVLEGATNLEIEGSSLRFRLEPFRMGRHSTPHWTHCPSGGELTVTHAERGYEVAGRAYLGRFTLLAMTAPWMFLLLGSPVWLVPVIAVGSWLSGYFTTTAGFQRWLSGVLSDPTEANHGA